MSTFGTQPAHEPISFGNTKLEIDLRPDCLVLGRLMDGKVVNLFDNLGGILQSISVQSAFQFDGEITIDEKIYLYRCHAVPEPSPSDIIPKEDRPPMLPLGHMVANGLEKVLTSACDRSINSLFENEPDKVAIGQSNEIKVAFERTPLYCRYSITGIKDVPPPRDRD